MSWDHGGEGAALAARLGVAPGGVLDLSASLNPVAPDPVPVLRRHLDAARRYADRAAVARATAALAEALGCDPRWLLLTNGGAEAIGLVAAELPEGWVEEPEFSLYRRHLAAVQPGAPRWRSNPRNPSGLLAAPGEQAAVWDEAFYALATGCFTRGDAERGAIVVGSLTKLLACPGLRVGYVLAAPPVIARVSARQPRWSVNNLAVSALPELLAPAVASLPAWVAAIAALRAELAELLTRCGLVPQRSEANWLLVRVPPGWRERLEAQAVLVRDCASFGLPDHVRIAVPSAAGIERLEKALCAL